MVKSKPKNKIDNKTAPVENINLPAEENTKELFHQGTKVPDMPLNKNENLNVSPQKNNKEKTIPTNNEPLETKNTKEFVNPNFDFSMSEETTNPPPQKKNNNSLPSAHPKKAPGQKLMWGLLVIVAISIMTFYGVMVWSFSSGNVSNPLFETLGIAPSELKGVLLNMTNFIFGLCALVLLISTAVPFFQWAMMDKMAFNRKDKIKKASINFLVFLLICLLWFLFYYLIQNAGAKKEFREDESMILTTPSPVIGLSSPVTIEFDIGQKLAIDPALIRQINWNFDGDDTIDASGPVVTHKFEDKGRNGGRFPVRAEVSYFSPEEDKEKVFTSLREVIIKNEMIVPVIEASIESGPAPLKVELDSFHSVDPDGEIISREWAFKKLSEAEIKAREKKIEEMLSDQHFENTSSLEESSLQKVVYEEFIPEEVYKTMTFTEAEVGVTNIEKKYMEPGQYLVVLRVKGRNNDIAYTEKAITVKEPEAHLRAEISSEQEFEGEKPYSIILDGINSFSRIGKIVRYEWRIKGEEELVVGRKFQKTFRNVGDYDVTLTIENEDGERSQITETIHIYKRKKEGDIQIRTTPPLNNRSKILTGNAPFVVTFDSSTSIVEEPIEWKWDFEDDGFVDDTGDVVQHVFRKPGKYNVKLIIIDSDEEVYEKIQQVVVERAGVRAKIVAEPPAGTVPLKISFDGSGSSTDEGVIVDYIWQFPDNDPIHYNAEINYEFTNIGVFTIKLTVVTSTGKQASSEYVISVRQEDVLADFTAKPSAGQVPLKVNFDPSSSTGSIVQYFWDFGDGFISSEYFPEHMYNIPGEYTVLLKVKDRSGIVSEEKHKIIVTK